MVIKNFESLIAKAKSVKLPTSISVSGGSSTYSFGIVNSSSNGKRMSFSKALVAKLNLNDTVFITPLVDDGKILVVGQKLFDATYECGLRGDSRKTSYRAGVVKEIVNAFHLDFGSHVSMTFTNIEFFEHEGVTVASIKLTEPIIDKEIAEE